MLSKTGWRQWPKIVVQNKETPTAPWSAAKLWERRRLKHEDAWLLRQLSGSLSWTGVDDSSENQHLQAAHAVRLQETANFQLGGPGKFTGADDPRHALHKHGGLADLWYVDDGDIMCHPILVPPYLQEFDDANAKDGAERTPQKTEVMYCVDDLGAAPPWVAN